MMRENEAQVDTRMIRVIRVEGETPSRERFQTDSMIH